MVNGCAQHVTPIRKQTELQASDLSFDLQRLNVLYHATVCTGERVIIPRMSIVELLLESIDLFAQQDSHRIEARNVARTSSSSVVQNADKDRMHPADLGLQLFNS